MKLKVTRRFVRENYKYVLFSSDISNILKHCGFNPIFYNCGYLGWNWDCYVIDDEIAIVTGYRSFPKYDMCIYGKDLSYLKNNIKGECIEERKECFKSLIYTILLKENK